MSAAEILNWAMGTSVSLSILIAIILIIRRPFAQRFGAKTAYALWALPIVRLFMPAIALPILKPALPEIPSPFIDLSVNYMGVDMVPIALQATTHSAPPPVNFMPALVLLWGMGAVVWLTAQLLRQRAYSRDLRVNSRLISEGSGGLHNANLKGAMAKLRVRAAPNIRLSKGNTGPLVTGLINPMIILPSNFETHFSPQQQHLALLHEMAHIRRRDLWAAFAALIFRALNWPNPLIHYAARKFRVDQEAACDASVLGLSQSPRSVYAETLVRAAQSASRPPHAVPLGLTIYHPLKERLMMMKTQKKRTSLLSRATAGALILGAFAFTAPLTLANGPDEPGLAGAPHTTTKSKKVIKIVEDVDGVKTEKKYEIQTENGVTTAWSIDELGNKMKVDPETINGLDHMNKFDHPNAIAMTSKGPLHMQMREFTDENGKSQRIVTRAIRQGPTFRYDKDGKRVLVEDGALNKLSDEDMEILMKRGNTHMVFVDENGDLTLKDMPKGKDVKIITMTSDHIGPHHGPGQHAKIMVKNRSSDDFNFTFDGNMHKGQHAEVMVEAASGLLDGVETGELPDKARRKIEKARKALKEAQEAIDAEK